MPAVSSPRSYLFVCGGSYVSGMEVVELAIMRELLARGARVHCIVSGWNDGVFIGRLEEAGIPYTVAFLGKVTFSLRRLDWTLDALRHLPGARRAVRQVVEAFRPECAVVCSRDSLLLLRGVFGGMPVAFHVHEAAAVSRRGRTLYRLLSASTDGFLVVSDFVGERLRALGVAPDRIHVVPNGVTLPPEPAPPSDGGPPVVGICGQIGPWKGHGDLVEALGRLAARGVRFELCVFGKGNEEYVEELRQRARTLGIGERVRWMGFEADLDRMYAGIDVLAMPSHVEESFGMSATEAAARGIPTVASRRGGLAEQIRDGETGRLVEPGAPDELADALADLLADADGRRAMGAAAREHVASRYLVRHMVDRFEHAAAAIQQP